MTPGDHRLLALEGLDLHDKVVLEYGPLNRPLVRKDESQVYYADHCSTLQLKNKYENDPNISVEHIVDIDLDLSTESETTLKERIGSFDFVVASHVIEHIPNLIGWLQQVYDLLQPAGTLALVIPDKRFTFDLHRRETPFWRIENDFVERRDRPSLGIVLDHFSNIVNIHNHSLWSDYNVGLEARLSNGSLDDWDPSHIITSWHAGHYIDAHCLVVTPWRFIYLIGKIVQQYNIAWNLKMFRSTPHNELEFYVQLERSASGASTTNWNEAFNMAKESSSRADIT